MDRCHGDVGHRFGRLRLYDSLFLGVRPYVGELPDEAVPVSIFTAGRDDACQYADESSARQNLYARKVSACPADILCRVRLLKMKRCFICKYEYRISHLALFEAEMTRAHAHPHTVDSEAWGPSAGSAIYQTPLENFG